MFYTIPTLDEEKSTPDTLTSPGGSSSSRDFPVNRVDSGEQKTCEHELVLPSVFPLSTEDVNTQERKSRWKTLSLPSVISQCPHTVCSSLCVGEQRVSGEELVRTLGEQRVSEEALVPTVGEQRVSGEALVRTMGEQRVSEEALVPTMEEQRNSGEALVPTVGEQRVSDEALVLMQGSSHHSGCLQSSQSLPKDKNGSEENLQPACRRSFSSRDRNFSSNSEQSSEYKSSGVSLLIDKSYF